MAIGHAADIALGGMCAWRLPTDASCASVARSLLGLAMTTLGLDRDKVDDATLAVSELATNALHHGLNAGPETPTAPPELWLWARATPTPQLVLTVFDACRSSWPDTTPRGLLDDHGRGIGIVAMLAEAWGAHPTRSICTQGVPGKAVWSAFALPGPWPNARTTAPPMLAARHLVTMLTARGVTNVTHRHGKGVSLVTIPLGGNEERNIWIESGHLSYTTPTGTRHRRPMIDLHDTTETLIHQLDEESRRGSR
ncbi:ATP-binding protein [Spirillospora sp. NPDC048823]|uniref:ATP-binding protein n=1 Tax=unclassified Spirillospora TaxID=2642701 RepID=UPI00371E678F